MNSSSIKDLPIQELIELALSEPIENIGDLCSTSNRLFRVCDNEMFWEERIKKDFPKYVSSLPSTLTYHQYYTMLWKSWNLRDNQSKFVFQDVPITMNDKLHLVYPVPRYDVDENGTLRPDIVIFRLPEENILFVGMNNRKLITGASLPNLDPNILQSIDTLIPGKRSYIQLYLDKNYRADRGGSFFVPVTAYRRLAKEAAEVGYLSTAEGVALDPNSELVTINRSQLKRPEKKPSPKLMEKASPPVNRNKLKGMFKAFSPSAGK